jgi:exonuclease SbcC
MITRVRLKNFRSHLDSELVFSTGTNALLGHLGSGKTSVLEGICFGLFGTTPLLQSKKLKLNDLLMNKPVAQNRAEVEVSFQVAEKIYSVKRVIERNKGTTYSELREEGKLIEAPNAQRVTELVEKILKVNFDLFSKAIYSEQNALDYFLTIPRGQRMKKMDELLMIDKFEEARSNCVTLENKIIERKIGKENLIQQVDIQQLQKSINDIKDSLVLQMQEVERLRKELESVTVEKVKLEKEVSELKTLKNQLEILKREEKGLSSAIEEIKKSLQNLENSLKGVRYEEVEKRLKEVTRFIKEVEDVILEKSKGYQKLQAQLSKTQAELDVLRREKLEKLEKEVSEKTRIRDEFEEYRKGISKDLEKDIKSKKELLEKLIGDAEATRARIQDLSDSLAQIMAIGGKCPVCESKLTPARKKMLIKQRKAKIIALQKELEELGEKRKAVETEISELEEVKKKLEEIKRELEDFESLKAELENARSIYSVLAENEQKMLKELNELEKLLKDLQEKHKIASEDKQKLEILMFQIKDYTEKSKRIAELISEREKYVTRIVKLEEILKGVDVEKKEREFTELVGKEKELVTKILGMESVIREKKERLKELEKTLQMVEKEKKEVERLETIVRELKIFEKALTEVQSELRREFVTSVNYTMNKLWPTLYPYKDFEGIRLNVEEGDYVLQLFSRTGGWVNVEGIASGGERSIACLALRIAFALVLAPQLRVAFLDEPSHNLDSKSLSELAITLRERVGEFLEQVILITHQEELMDAVNGKSYRLERDKFSDGVTRVEPLE